MTNMTMDRIGQEPGDEWRVVEPSFSAEHLAKYETLLAQGNGYLGQRAALDERYVGQTRDLFVCGTFDRFHSSEVSELPNLPDITNLELDVNGKTFSLLRGTVKEYGRYLNLYTGELNRKVRWVAPDGTALTMVWRRMVSARDPHLMAASLEVTPDRPVALCFRSGIDCRVTNGGTQHMVEGDARVLEGKILQYPVKTLQSGIQVVLHTTHRLTLNGQLLDPEPEIEGERRYLAAKFRVAVAAGQTVRLEKISSVHTARDLRYAGLSLEEANRRVLPDSLADFRRAAAEPYAVHFRRSAAVWAEFWQEQDVAIRSRDPFDQLAVRFAIYHMRIMANQTDSRIGIGAKGLTGEGYKGHSFWDTELYIFPCFLFSQPETARRLLEYRYLMLDGARRGAAAEGCRGARFPWEAGWIEDGDVTPTSLGVDLVTGEPVPCLTGTMQLHVTADVAYAVHSYYEATGDEDFMIRCGYELLLETALYWADRLEPRNGRYELTHVIGPDEYQVDVDNNAYTNYLVAWNLRYGLEAAEKVSGPLKQRLEGRLGPLPALAALLRERLEGIYLPQPDPDTGLLPQFDGYFSRKPLDLRPYKEAPRVGEILKDYSFRQLNDYQASKQADVVQLLYLDGELFSGEVRRKNYLYYEQRTLHDSSLSKTVHAILASDLDMTEEAYAMFRGAAQTDLGPAPDSCDAGIHAANMGGIWQDVVMGFGGARMLHGRLSITPHLPPHWQELRYRLRWQGRRLTVTVGQEELRIYNQGEAMPVWVCGRETVLPGNQEAVFSWKGDAFQ